MKNHFYKYVVILLIIPNLVACQTKKQQAFVEYVVQPEVEIGKSIDFSIRFEEKPDSIWCHSEFDGLELTNKLDDNLNINESSLSDEDDKVIKAFYSFSTYAKPTKLGKIEFPILSVMYKGKIYKTSPYSINVVEKINITEDDVKVIWSTEKTTYKKKEVVKISLYEYSKFSATSRIHYSNSTKGLSAKGKGNKITVEKTIDNIAGIDGFEKAIYEKFDIEEIDYNMFHTRKSMSKIGNEVYIKKLILELSLKPTTKGEFEIGPSSFDFSVYKSNTDYFKKFKPNDDGSYKVTDEGSKQFKIESNTLMIKVK